MNALEQLNAASKTFESTYPNLKLLILFGSRARGEQDPTSDWDFAFLAEPVPVAERKPFWFSGFELLNTLSHLLQISEEKIDIVDLDHCSDLLAHVVARDGQLIYEKTPGEFARFQYSALKSKAELSEFRQSQRQKILQALQQWGV